MKKFLLLSAALLAVSAASAQDFDVYVIGSSVNGQSWATGAEDAKMTYKGDGVYEWNGEYLGSGFKFNDGTWSDDNHNWGAGEEMVLGEEYSLVAAGYSGNISFGDSFTGVNKPHIVFTIAEDGSASCVVTGEKTGVVVWYLSGDFNAWAIDDKEGAVALAPTEDDKVFEVKNVEFLEEGTFKIASTGFAMQYGSADGTIMVGFGELSVTLDKVDGEGGAASLFLIGEYDCIWNKETHVVTFAESQQGAVNAIEAVQGGAKYYNLQGVEVAAPSNGVYVKVANGKATKVAIR